MKTLKRMGGVSSAVKEKTPFVSTSEVERLPEIPSPYKIRDLIVRQTQALESHTAADDKWRSAVLGLIKQRLHEKDEVIECIKEDRIYAEKDKVRLYKIAIISLLGVLLLAGIKVAELVGII